MRRLLLAIPAVLLATLVMLGVQQFSPTGGQPVASASTFPQCVNPIIHLNIPSLNALQSDGTALPIDAISFGIASSSSGGISKSVASTVSINRGFDAHTLTVFGDLINDQNLGTVTALFFNTGTGGVLVQCESVTFYKAVYATSQIQSGSAGGGTPQDGATLEFAAMALNTGGYDVSWDFTTNSGSGGPTDARVMRLQVARVASGTVLRWMVSSNVGIVGFYLSAAKVRLTRGLISVHRRTTYHAVVPHGTRGPIVLHTLLSSGHDVTTPVR
jgi:hypothetical protein